MRLCRFDRHDKVDVGLYMSDGSVLPFERAASEFRRVTGASAASPTFDDLLPYLPGGERADEARRLAEFVSHMDESDLDRLRLREGSFRLLVPVPRPNKLLLLAGNYAKHVEERGGIAAERAETFPYVFWKPPTTTLTNPGDPIVIPRSSPDHVDWESELGVIMGKTCRNVSEAQALHYVAGYTVINDISDRKFTPNPSRTPRDRDKFFDWLHGKWHDTFCPMGPCVLAADGVDPQALRLTLKVNGETKQDATTAKMVFPVAAVISFISGFVTLEPGDVISTGTPSGVGSATGTYLRPGDVVEASIDEIGVLRNPVIAG